jgi:hypothetical protein
MTGSESPMSRLSQHVCLYASFDSGFDADVARGDRAAAVDARCARLVPDGGRFGGALWIDAHAPSEQVEVAFRGAGNFPYRTTPFDGTISLWLNLNPDEDLDGPTMVDPIQVSRTASDASFYLDLTRLNDPRYGSPRKLRLGMYPDNPSKDLRHGQLVLVGELGWQRGEWHHVCATWRNVNGGEGATSAHLYVDGILRGWMEGFTHRLTWDTAELTIDLGLRYAGGIDELLILDAALTAEEVGALFRSAQPAGTWIGADR